MTVRSRLIGQPLLQQDPVRAALVGLAKVQHPSERVHLTLTPIVRSPLVLPKSIGRWALPISLVLLLLLTVSLLSSQTNAANTQAGYQTIQSLPNPKKTLTKDEQALYWTYALYDFKLLKKNFGVEGFLAIDQKSAKQKLKSLLPSVSDRTLGIVSAYTKTEAKSELQGIKSSGAENG